MPSRPSRALLGLLPPAVVLALITWQVAADGPLLRTDARLSHALVRPDRLSELLSDLGEVQIAVPALLLVAAGVAYGSAVLVLLPWLRTTAARRLAVATGALLVAAVSFGLVRRGYHWPLDVVASWCLCAVLLGALRLWLAAAALRDGRRPACAPARPRQSGAPRPPTRTTRTSEPSASRTYGGARKPQDTP
ncbi:hypothetical protein JHN52_26475 [Streptomyces sp. MBT97]|uniref:phosphatase PAP2 family protein n=1 Tax=Streptomyces sp. MBT97 TaxID=2800411 RepID=UPI00190BBF2C|nr:phosphatase PAP2 family protein [Streptomyces sp. MBT97]MBK3636396.1 hypothetical protein [Streptomyces sp. MBT97]